MDIIMTAKHVMHNIFFFCLFSINITEAIYNWDSNKTSTIHLTPCFQWLFFSSSDKCIIVFHSLKYYTVKKKQKTKNPICIVLLSCNFLLGGGGSTATMFSDHLPEYFLKLPKWNSSMPSVPLLHTARTYYSSPWQDFYIQSPQERSNPSLYISLAWVRSDVFTMNGISFSEIIYI